MLRLFRHLVRRSPALALAVLGLFALAVETAQKPEEESGSQILPGGSSLDLESLPAGRSGSVGVQFPGGGSLPASLFASIYPPVTNRWDAQAQRILEQYGDGDDDGLSDAEERAGLALLDVQYGQALHVFAEDARIVRFPTPADYDCRSIALPFGFPLGGTVYTQAFVHVDGAVGFGYPSLPVHPEALPFTNVWPSALIAPFWADLALDPGTGRVWTQPLTDPATGATNGCVVAWEGLRLGTNAQSSVTFQAELHASGLVRLLHGPMTGVADPGAAAVVGVQTGTNGWSFSAFDSALVVPGQALRLWSTVLFDAGTEDSDGDGTQDGVEWRFSVPRPDGRTFSRSIGAPDPEDFDNDGLGNRVEYDLGTEARWYDSDGDALPDGWELDNNLDPLSTIADDGAEGDPDDDERINLAEFRENTDPHEPDAPDGVAEGLEAWVNITLGTETGHAGEVHLVTLQGLGDESTRSFRLHNWGGEERTLRVPLAVGSDYAIDVTTYGPLAASNDLVNAMASVAISTDEGVCLGVFDPNGKVDSASDGHGGTVLRVPAPGTVNQTLARSTLAMSTATLNPSAGTICVCCNEYGPFYTDITGIGPVPLVFDPLNTMTNIGVVAMLNPPRCGTVIDWAAEDPSTWGPAAGISFVQGLTEPESPVFADWTANSGMYYSIGTTRKNCRYGYGDVQIASRVRIGLDVTDAMGTGGPDGSVLDGGDDLKNYLPGETLYGGPVIKWDNVATNLVTQHLRLQVESDGITYTNAKFTVSAPTTQKGWCTNTRNPRRDECSTWFNEDYSLSEAAYLSVTNIPFSEGVAAADLFCRDYGAKCKIFVDLTGVNDAPPVTREFTIPLDTDTDGIADCWETAKVAEWNSVYGTNMVATLDVFAATGTLQELSDPDGIGWRASHASAGDGIPPSKEYRGFSLPGLNSATGRPHIRFSPARKDLLVWADMVTTNGVLVLSTNEATAAMTSLRSVFDHDLGIELHWVLGAPRECEGYSGRNLNQIVADYIPSGGADFGPPLHVAESMKRLVLTTGLPPDAKGHPQSGTTNDGSHRSAAVDVGYLRASVAPSNTSPLQVFLQHYGVTFDQRVAELAIHETGHLAGCSGDVEIMEPAPALRIKVRGTYGDGRDIRCNVEKRGGQVVLTVKRADQIQPDIVLPLLGPQTNLTVGQTATAINAYSNYTAEACAPHVTADATRLCFGDVPLPPSDGWTNIFVQAELNGVMSYNTFSTNRYLRPGFDNVAASATNGPLKELFRIETGSVRVGN